MKKNTMKKIISILTFALLILSLNSCADLFQGKVSGDFQEYESLKDIVRSDSTDTQLATPEQVYVSQYENSSYIYISWNAVENAGYYKLERAV
ncbi:MAG: hypothetical protein K5839_03370, partial [Treponemataceae bacterium]|nr:hypothetical protein [Treponemataceae bacterium]